MAIRLGLMRVPPLHFARAALCPHLSLKPTSFIPRLYTLPNLTHARALSQRAEITDSPTKPGEVCGKALKQLPGSPQKNCQYAAFEDLGANSKALMIKTMLSKGATLDEVLYYFSEEIADSRVLYSLLRDANSRKALIDIAVSKPENSVLSSIYDLVSLCGSDKVRCEIAQDMTQALLSLNKKNSKEILKWIVLGCSTKHKDEFVKGILLIASSKDEPLRGQAIAEASGCSYPLLAKDCWRHKFLSLYRDYYKNDPEFAALAWAFFLKLPLPDSLKDKFLQIPRTVWDPFFRGFQDLDKKKQVMLEFSTLFSRSTIFMTPKEKLYVSKISERIRNEFPYNAGC